MGNTDLEQTNLRLPTSLKKWLQEQANAARRSLTAEVIVRLEQSRESSGYTVPTPMPHNPGRKASTTAKGKQ